MKKSILRGTGRAAVIVLVAAGLVISAGGAPAFATASPGSAHAAAGSTETHGLKGEYFRMSAPGARDLVDLAGTALDTGIDFQDLTTVFKSVTGQTENTTARWTGSLEVPTTDDYTFYAIGDNGFRLWVDGSLVIDHWLPDWDNEQTSVAVHLGAGVRHDFKLEYFQDTGGASMHLRWSSPTMAKQLVPETAYTPPTDFEVFPVDYALGADGVSMLATFSGPVGKVDDFGSHLSVDSDTTSMPIAGVAVSPVNQNAIVISLGAAVQKNAQVRVSYDGKGALTVGGREMPSTIRGATNGSTQRLLTTWGETLDKNAPLPEYPRPQLTRDDWLNLNGQWEFASAKQGEQPTFGSELGERITVPFPVESQLSGIERHEDYMFYRKLVTVPTAWNIGSGERLKLNFGAVDYKAQVWVNGKPVAKHTGGYLAFSADITDALVPGAAQEIIVGVEDTTNPDQTVGKQSSNPSGIVYTASSGIWQTVWLEPVAPATIDSLVSTPYLKNDTLAVTVRSGNAPASAAVTITASDTNGKIIASVTGAANTELTLPIASAHLWTPEDPYLYTLSASLVAPGSVDTVGSYFGMRSIGLAEIGGVQKIVLNGKPIYSLAMLDQGFWPDGLYTAPSDDALKFDLQTQKNLGFNAVRKHIKVEPARWYYHADQLGLLVWQDFVSSGNSDGASQQEFLQEARDEMAQLHNSPAVIGWIPFNEGWGEWDRTTTGQIAEDVKTIDPSRLVDAHSGVNCCASKGDSGQGDVIDHHDYTNSEPAFPDATRAAMDGEHGGFTLRTPGHMWPGAPAAIYSGVDTKADLTAKYVQNTQNFYLSRAGTDLSGSVYTQVTDVENEINGMMSYDRKVMKVDEAAVRVVNLRVIAAGSLAGAPVAGNAHWPLDEGAGASGADSEAKDGANSVTLNADTKWTTGVKGSALAFNGNSDYAETSGAVLDTSKSYTVSAWVTLDKLPGNYATAVSQDGAQTENPFYLQYGQGAFSFSLPGGNRARLVSTPDLNTWYQLVGEYDKGNNVIRLYVNGALAATTPAEASSVLTSTGPLSIGRGAFNHTKGDWWSGSIDEVRTFDTALGADAVAALYTDITSPSTPVPTGDPVPAETPVPTGSSASTPPGTPGDVGNSGLPASAAVGANGTDSGGLAATGLAVVPAGLAAIVLLAIGAGLFAGKKRKPQA